MQNQENRNKENPNKQHGVDSNSKGEQQQTDPQVTELRGFANPSEDLEPTLEDGSKAPDKEPPPSENK